MIRLFSRRLKKWHKYKKSRKSRIDQAQLEANVSKILTEISNQNFELSSQNTEEFRMSAAVESKLSKNWGAPQGSG